MEPFTFPSTWPGLLHEEAPVSERAQALEAALLELMDAVIYDSNNPSTASAMRLGKALAASRDAIDMPLPAPAEGVSPQPGSNSLVIPDSSPVSTVEPTPEPPRLDADYTDPRFWASGVPNQPQPTGAPAPCVWREKNVRGVAGCGGGELYLEHFELSTFVFCPYCGSPLTVER